MASSVTLTFSWYDYIIFSVMLTMSVLIGIYFGCFGTKQSSASEYLMGSKKMKVFPIVMSLVASHISGITLLGVPADVYKSGAGYWLSVPLFLAVAVVSTVVYLPVLFNAQVTSVYEYLEKRFDHKTRVYSSFLFALSQMLFLPIVVYIPALAFSAATGINLHLITPIICGVCIFYTTIGGLKAVVWTDTLQFTVTLGAVTTVVILGVKASGGFGNIWSKAIEGHRLDIFDFDPDVTRSDNFWAPLLGLFFFWLSSTNTNQGCVQKILSVSTLKEARVTIFAYFAGMATVKSASVLTGLIIYAKYFDCDPFLTGKIKRKDQLLPFFVLDVAGNIPGLAGLFIAGVFSAGLSTLSAHLNCLSGTIYEDFLSRFIRGNISERAKSNVLKLIVVVSGTVCTLLVFIFEHLGGIFPLAIAFGGITGGPMLGMFTLGILFRRANSKGAFYGGIIGLVALVCLALPAKYLQTQGIILGQEKAISVEGCSFHNFTTTPMPSLHRENDHLAIFKVSFYYYNLIGTSCTVVSGLIISYCTEDEGKKIDEDLLSPMIRRTDSDDTKADLSKYNTVERALQMVTNRHEESKM